MEFTAEYFNRKCGEGLTVDEMAIKAIQLENSVELWPAANNDKGDVFYHLARVASFCNGTGYNSYVKALFSEEHGKYVCVVSIF